MTALRLPDDDRERSPHTGWTREHWVALADQLLLAARPHATDSHGLILFPGAPPRGGYAISGLEGFARSFLAAGFLVAGAHGEDPHDHLEWYAQGLGSGTDPSSPDAWPGLDGEPQARVEAASVALVLHLTRPWLWDRLDDRVRAQVVDYLAPAVGARYVTNNWVWFQIVTEQFLANVGLDGTDADIDRGLEFHESLYDADGWHHDGVDTRSFDHYNGWALHTFPLLWCAMAGDDPRAATRRTVFRERLDRYLTDAAHLVGGDGAPLFQGRSLIYRFASAAPFWTGALSGSSTLSAGLVRRAASGIAQHFVARGAPNEHGVLTMGWHHTWRAMAQDYSGPGSPYWASMGLLGLLLPKEHPVWAAVEEPLPVEKGDSALTVRAPGWLVSGTRADGIVRVVNHGTDHAAPGDLRADLPLYTRLGYSTRTAPILPGTDRTKPAGVDSSVALLDDHGRLSHRLGFEALGVELLPGTDVAVGLSRARAHWLDPEPAELDYGAPEAGEVTVGPWVTTGSVVRGADEIRVARVEGEGRYVLQVTGWPLSSDGEPARRGADDGSLVVAGGLVSHVDDLAGLPDHGTARYDGHSPLGRWTAVPWRATSGPAVPGRWYAAVVRLAGATVQARAPLLDTARLEGGVLMVDWPDGLRTEIDLNAKIRPVAHCGTTEDGVQS